MAVKFKDTININGQYTLPEQDGTVDQVLSTDGAGVISFVDLPDGEAVKIACKNTTASTITKGTPVYVTGTVGTSFIVQIAPADAANSAKMPAVGLLETDLAANGEGFIVTGGLLKNLTTDPIDGTTPSSNDTIYVKAGGGLTMTKPTGSNLIQNIGKVGRVNSSNAGSVIVSSILRTNDVPNLTEGKIWVGSANNTIESTVVHIDEANTRVGINQSTPDVTLDITGTDAIQIPKGTDAQRPTPESGMIRFNTTAGEFEGYNGTEWAPIGGANTASIDIDNFTGDGTTVSFTLTSEIQEEDNTQVYIDGVYQSKSNYTTSGTTLTFSTAPPTGTSIEVVNFTGIAESQLDGTGTANYIPKWQDADTLANSIIFDNGINVGIGTATPLEHLHIKDSTAADSTTIRIEGFTNAANDPIAALEFYNTTSAPSAEVAGFIKMQAASGGRRQYEMLFGTGNSANASTKMVINKDGSVGIGTDSPNYPLTVHSTGDGVKFEVSDTVDANYRIQVSGNDIKLGSSTASDQIFITGNTERMRIASSGNVGIGTASPAVNLDILNSSASGILRIKDVNAADVRLSASGNASSVGTVSNHDFRINSNNNPRITIDSGGSIGIGTTSPTTIGGGAKLTVSQGADGNIVFARGGSTRQIQLGTTSTTGYINVDNTTDGLTFNVNTTERVRIDSSGNVIKKVASAANGGYATNDGTNDLIAIGTGGYAVNGGSATDGGIRTTNNLVFATGSGAPERMRIDSSGVVQVRNQTPTIQLYNTDTSVALNQTLGDIDWYQSDPSDAGVGTVAKIRAVNTSTFAGYGELAFHTGNATTLAEHMRITSSGNVGIGTTSPAHPLHIASSTNNIMRLQSTDQTVGNLYFSYADSTGSEKAFIGFGGSSDDTFSIWNRKNAVVAIATNNTERMRIDSGGVVGMGVTGTTSFDGVPRLIVGNVSADSGIAIFTPSANAGYLQFADGTSGAEEYRGFIKYDHSTNAMSFSTNSTARTEAEMTIDSSGNVGIGTTSPQRTLDVNGEIQNTGIFRRAGIVMFKADGTSMKIGSSNASGGDITFHTTANLTSVDEKMRITSGGALLFATTDTDVTNNTSGSGFNIFSDGLTGIANTSYCLDLNRTNSTNGEVARFRKQATQVGNISVTGSSTAYNTSSDYRLKENVVEMTGALDRVDALKPSRFNFIADPDKIVDGFLAHEVADVVPEAITGEKDATEEYEVTPAILDEDGNVVEEAVMGTRPVYQGIDQSKLVPLLVGAIQELRAEIETLKSQINP